MAQSAFVCIGLVGVWDWGGGSSGNLSILSLNILSIFQLLACDGLDGLSLGSDFI